MTIITKVLMLALTLVSIAGLAAADDVNGDRLEMVLLPFAFRENVDEIHGAYGTIWTGQVWLENRDDNAVPLHDLCQQAICPGMDPNTAGRLMTTPLGVNPAELGLLMFIPAEQAKNVTWSNRIFERTLRSQPRGVDVPVVREGDFFDTPQTFLGVPSGESVRLSLRVYDPWINYSSGRPAPVLEGLTVQIRDPQGVTIGTTTLRPAITSTTNAWYRPGFSAIYDIAAAFPVTNAAAYLHIRVSPVPANAQYYAMVAVTDNLTQTVSIITAQ